MKFRTTRKEIQSAHKTIYKLGYCEAQYLLQDHSPVAYTCGTNGWNADIYLIDGVCICTGYRPFGQYVPYGMVHQYEQAATGATGEERSQLMASFVREIQGGN